MKTLIPTSKPDCEIVTVRILNFHRSLVYTAWSEPEHLKNWWGPKGFTNTFHEFDFRPGGKWKFTMHGPEKGNYKNECEFLQIDKPSLISWKRHSQPLFNVVVSFEEIDKNTTKVTFRMIFATSDECNKIKKFVIDKNEENFDKIEAELKRMI